MKSLFDLAYKYIISVNRDASSKEIVTYKNTEQRFFVACLVSDEDKFQTNTLTNKQCRICENRHATRNTIFELKSFSVACLVSSENKIEPEIVTFGRFETD